MINYDIPWNPVRLEQRIGRIHRYGQEHDCLIFNFVAQNTREGRVLQKLLERLREIRNELGTDQVFDVVGEIFPANLLEKLFRDLYARRTNEHDITTASSAKPTRADSARSRNPPWRASPRGNSTCRRSSARPSRPRKRRLVPEVIEDFFVAAAPETGISPTAGRQGQPRLPHREVPAHADPARQHAGAPLRQTRPGIRPRRLRQGLAEERPDPRMGDAWPSSLRGGPRRSPRPRP